MLHYGYSSLCNKPNSYPFIYFPIPTDSFVYKDGIVQKNFPLSHLYIPNESNVIDRIKYTTIKDIQNEEVCRNRSRFGKCPSIFSR